MKKKIKKEKKDYIKLLPIALILAIVPLIVYMKEVKIDESFSKYWKGKTFDNDFFSYYKMTWFIALTCIAVLIFFAYSLFKKIEISLPKMFIPLGVYITFVFLSSTFSDFHTQAFFGYPDRYEGFFTILCYTIVCLLCSLLINSEFDFKYLVYFLAFSVFVLSWLGISQFFDFDFLQTELGKRLMLPASSKNLINSFEFNFPKQYIYSTLYNPNYVGGFFSIILAICIVIFISSKKIKYKVISGIFSLLSFINLVGSFSFAGFIGILASGVIIIVYLRKHLIRNLAPIAIILLCFTSILVFMNQYSNGKVLKEFKIADNINFDMKDKLTRLISTASSQSRNNLSSPLNSLILMNNSNNTDDRNNNVSYNEYSAQELKSQESYGSISGELLSLGLTGELANQDGASRIISNIKLNKNTATIFTSDTDSLVIKYDPTITEILFFDNNNDKVNILTETSGDEYTITFSDPRFNTLKVSVKGNVLLITAPNTAFNLIITNEGIKFLTPAGIITDMLTADSFGFKGWETWGSNRGYIWSRTIPMLKETVLLGHGPDTFAMYFPQNDYVAKMKYLNSIYLFVDKPHNLYLQIGINSGLISLLAFLVFIGWYYIQSLTLYFKDRSKQFFTPGVACLAGVTSFLVSSLANDSAVSISPLFWIILGTGIACNRLYKKSISTN